MPITTKTIEKKEYFLFFAFMIAEIVPMMTITKGMIGYQKWINRETTVGINKIKETI
jgi:hypothetical protein